MSIPRRTIKPSVRTGSVSREEVRHAVRAAARGNDTAASAPKAIHSKSYLIDGLSTQAKLTRADAKRVVDALFSSKTGIIAEALRKGDRVSIGGFGSFEKTEAFSSKNFGKSRQQSSRDFESAASFTPNADLLETAK